jgi:hypothetical protein
VAAQELAQELAQTDAADSEATEETEEESKDSKARVDASIGLINTGPVSLELTIDDPVTSGSDGPGL